MTHPAGSDDVRGTLERPDVFCTRGLPCRRHDSFRMGTHGLLVVTVAEMYEQLPHSALIALRGQFEKVAGCGQTVAVDSNAGDVVVLIEIIHQRLAA